MSRIWIFFLIFEYLYVFSINYIICIYNFGVVAILQYIILLVFLGIDHYVLLSKIDDYSVAGVILVLLRFSTSLMLATHKGWLMW